MDSRKPLHPLTASLLVATLAVTPLAAGTDLTDFGIPSVVVQPPIDGIALPVLRIAEADRECRAEEHSEGVGGQEVACTFACVEGDQIALGVDAEDADAEVRGEAACGSARIECGPKAQACAADGDTDEKGAGECRGRSEEAWDSGLQVECSASGGGGGAGDPPTSECIRVLGEDIICKDDDAGSVPPQAYALTLVGLSACLEKKYEEFCRLPATTARVTRIYALGGDAVVARCEANACTLAPVIVAR